MEQTTLVVILVWFSFFSVFLGLEKQGKCIFDENKKSWKFKPLSLFEILEING